MSFSLQKQSFDTYVKTIIAENEVELKRKQLGELKEKLIDLNAEIDEIEITNQQKTRQINSFWKKVNDDLEQYYDQQMRKVSHFFDEDPSSSSQTFLVYDLSPQTSAVSLRLHFTRWGRVGDIRICHFKDIHLLCGFVRFAHKVHDFPKNHFIDNSFVYLIADPKENHLIAVEGKLDDLNELSMMKLHFSKFGEIDFIHKSATSFGHIIEDSHLAFIMFKPPGAPKNIASNYHEVAGKTLVVYEIN